jgi:hypothetical protein
MPLEAGDHLGAGSLIGPHRLAQFFRVELASERSRVDQITKQHSEQNPQSARRNNFPSEHISRWFLLFSENLSASNYPGAASELTPFGVWVLWLEE